MRAREARYAESLEASHSSQGEAARIGELLGVTAPPLRLDSQTKYALVARGDASIYLRIPRAGYVEWVWDHAAGSIVVEEAGGVVSDIDGARSRGPADVGWIAIGASSRRRPRSMPRWSPRLARS
ncbi:MAG: inositol monophosphatase family protein [Chloroflexota bacterium]